jgi:hypothetical protein
MKKLSSLVFLFAAVTACSKGAKGVPCEASALAKIGEGAGKPISLTGCTFSSQGNDIVAFSDTTSQARSIDCKMKGGHDAVTDFRHAAMKLDMKKLRLDVQGTVSGKDGLTDCEISPHE